MPKSKKVVDGKASILTVKQVNTSKCNPPSKNELIINHRKSPRSPRMRRASFMSLGVIVTRFA